MHGQATTYCLMLGVEAADLVQCLRASSSESTIHVTRIPLHGPPLHHGPAWWSHVLPRLYAFARAVHAFRGSSALRYAYLLGGDEARDALLARHLPHLPFRPCARDDGERGETRGNARATQAPQE